jgi:hypothetical protein
MKYWIVRSYIEYPPKPILVTSDHDKAERVAIIAAVTTARTVTIEEKEAA